MSKPNKNTSFAKFVRDFVSRSEAALMPFIIAGDLNREYIEGNQYKRIDPKTLTIKEKTRDLKTYKERKVFNKMLPIYLARQGIMSANRPIIGFKPDHNYPESVNSSLTGNQYLREFNKEVNISKLYDRIIRHADMYALVWVKSGLDWSKGDKMFEYEVKSDKTEDKVMRNFHEGRPFVDVYTLDEVFPDTLTGDTMEDINALVHRTIMSVDKIRDKYQAEVKGELITNRDPDWRLNRLQNLLEYAYVYEYYERASAKYPQGRFVITSRDYIFFDGPLPYENGANGRRRIPFDFYNLQALANKIPGVTAYNMIIDQQDAYNTVKNRLLEYINHIAIGQMFEWADSLVTPNSWSNKPGERIILKRHAKAPIPVQKAPVGNEINLYAKSIEEDMLTTAGLSPLTAFGMSKSNVRTDGVADKISESDDNKLTTALSNVADVLIDIYKKVIYLEKQRQDILINNLKLEMKDSFVVKYNMKGVDPEELVVTNREFLMQSDLAIEKKTAQAAQLGVYNPQSGLSYRSKLELLDVLDSGYLKDTVDPVERANFGRIMREHRKMIEGKNVEVDALELHEMHVQEHTIFLLSPEVSDLELSDPKVYALCIEILRTHIDKHKGFIQQSSTNTAYKNAKAFQ